MFFQTYGCNLYKKFIYFFIKSFVKKSVLTKKKQTVNLFINLKN